MRVELWEFNRCCFCVPLRYGILITGYIKLIISSLLLIRCIWGFVDFIIESMKWDNDDYLLPLVVITVFIIILMGDVALTIVYLVGSHKKCVKLLRVYYYYSIGTLVLSSLGFLFAVGYNVYTFHDIFGVIYAVIITKDLIAFGLLDICFQIYMILVNRSEIKKLEMNRNFHFTNMASEALCKMNEGDNGINVENRGPVDPNEANNENEENDQTEKKIFGSDYSKLV